MRHPRCSCTICPPFKGHLGGVFLVHRERTHEAHQLVQHAHVLLEVEIQCSPQALAKVLGVGLNL